MPISIVPRTFDLSAGQHPVTWLLETLSVGEGILEALSVWLEAEVVPGKVYGPVKLDKAESSFA